MVRTSLLRASLAWATRSVWLAVTLALVALLAQPRQARAGDPPPELLIRDKAAGDLHALPKADEAGHAAGRGHSGMGGWLVSTSGLVLALAVFGGLSLASRRWLTRRAPGPMEVLARASLSPKHTVYLVRVADRTLILGAGAQGPPSLLGELTTEAEPDGTAAYPAPTSSLGSRQNGAES